MDVVNLPRYVRRFLPSLYALHRILISGTLILVTITFPNSPALAIAPTTVNCGTSGTFTISSNTVTANTACTGTVTVPEGVTSIGYGAFYAADISGTVTLPSTLLTIGTSAFYATGEIRVVIPKSVTTMDEAFWESNIVSLTFETPSSLTSIGATTIRSTRKLPSLVLPEGITSLGSLAVATNLELRTLTLPSTITSIDYQAFLQTPKLVCVVNSSNNALVNAYAWDQNPPSSGGEAFPSSSNAMNFPAAPTIVASISDCPAMPTISSISRSSGSAQGGTSVVISGTNLTGTRGVRIGTINATVDTVTPTAVTIRTPVGSGSGLQIHLIATGGWLTASPTYSYIAAPTITSNTPISGDISGGTLETVTGTNLSGVTSITIGGSAATVQSNTATTLVVTVPTGSAGAKDIVITNPGGTVTSSGAYTYIDSTPVVVPQPPVPDPIQRSSITSISPDSAEFGIATQVVIAGNFVENITSIWINDVPLTSGGWTQTSSSISLTVPIGPPGKYAIRIYNGSRPQLAATEFAYTGPPVLNWTQQKAASSAAWNSVAFGNSTFVAVGSSSNGAGVMNSKDGKNWLASTGIASNNWVSVAFGNGIFVAVASNGRGNRIMSSADGITWKTQTINADYEWAWLKFGSGVFVAVSKGMFNRGKIARASQTMYSADGITWKNSELRFANGNPFNPNQTVTSLGFGNGIFSITGEGARSALGTSDLITTSSDGVIWTWDQQSIGVGAIRPVGFQGYGCGRYLAMASYSSRVAVTNHPQDWNGRREFGGPGFEGYVSVVGQNALNYIGGLFVSVGNRISALSNNSATWITQQLFSNNNWSSLTYGNGLFVAVASTGSDDRVMTAPYLPVFTLSKNLETVSLGSAIAGYKLEYKACSTATYKISPAITDSGLRFDAATGLLSGTPTKVAEETAYTISVQDGSEYPITATFNLIVKAATTSTGNSGSTSAGKPEVKEESTSSTQAPGAIPETQVPTEKPDSQIDTQAVAGETLPQIAQAGPLSSPLKLKIYFNMSSSKIDSENFIKLQGLAKSLANLGDKITISITGYAQPTPGSEATDGALSQNRAASVAKILRSFGVNTKVIYKGAGRAKANIPTSRYVEIVAVNK